MINYCGECFLCDKSNKRAYYDDQFYCIEKKKYVKSTDRVCKKISDLDRNESSKSSFKPFGFYIVTVVNEILGFGENSEFMRVFREAGMMMRNSSNHLYETLLEDYDVSGLTIAEKIKRMPNSKEFASYLYSSTLLPIMHMIKNDNKKEALTYYVRMVNNLKNEMEVSGMIETDYEAAIIYQDDVFARVTYDYLGEEVKGKLDVLSNYIKENGMEDPELYDIYNSVGVELSNLYYFDESNEAKIRLNQYFKNHIRIILKDIKVTSSIEEIKGYLKNLLFKMNADSISRISADEIVDDVYKREILLNCMSSR